MKKPKKPEKPKPYKTKLLGKFVPSFKTEGDATIISVDSSILEKIADCLLKMRLACMM